MEGYSVTEAASVLGVPTERVWELLARGVLSGAPEGETGMRVYLQPRPAPVPPSVSEPAPSNGHGDGRGSDVESSPFRELLTEFRNLTERYGQALLALGEARGEVASLRSRVDVLEARMDLRLPFEPTAGPAHAPRARESVPRPPRSPQPESGPTLADEAEAIEAVPPVSDTAGRASERGAQPVADPEPAPRSESGAESQTAEPDDEAERSARRKRTRAHFVEEFAEALARAEDPSPSELPGSVEARAALAALQADLIADDTGHEQEQSDATLPRELPAAEPMIEPEVGTSDAPPVEVLVPEPEPEPASESRPQPEAEIAAAPAAEAAVEPDREPEPEPPIATDGAAERVNELVAEDTWDRDRYTAVIEEPDWWTPDAAGWDDPLPAPGSQPAVSGDDASVITPEPATAEPEGEGEMESETESAPGAQSASDDGAKPDESTPSEFAASIGLDDPIEPDATPAVEETMLWFGSRPRPEPMVEEPADDPAAEMEIASTGHTPSLPQKPLPGSEDLDAALAALGDRGTAQPRPTSGDATRARALPPATPPRAIERPRTVELPGPASRAYRRLRRIFPS